MLTELYQYYIEHPEAMSGEYRELISRNQESVAQAVCDYLCRDDRPVFHGKVPGNIYTESMGSILAGR